MPQLMLTERWLVRAHRRESRSRKGEPERPGARYFKPLRQLIESVNDTFKGQLGLEQHGAPTRAGVLARVWQQILALTATIWHNDKIGAPIKRSLIAYYH